MRRLAFSKDDDFAGVGKGFQKPAECALVLVDAVRASLVYLDFHGALPCLAAVKKCAVVFCASSACFSPVNSTQASWLTAVYQYKQDTTTGAWRYVAMDQVSGALGATEAQTYSTGQFGKMNTWFKSLMAETFS